MPAASSSCIYYRPRENVIDGGRVSRCAVCRRSDRTITDMAIGTNIQSTQRTLEGLYEILMVNTCRIPDHSRHFVSESSRSIDERAMIHGKRMQHFVPTSQGIRSWQSCIPAHDHFRVHSIAQAAANEAKCWKGLNKSSLHLETLPTGQRCINGRVTSRRVPRRCRAKAAGM